MTRQDPRSVFVTDDLTIAEFVTEWLNKQGAKVELVKHFKESVDVGISGLSDSEGSSHLELHAVNPEDVEGIRNLILENSKTLLQEAKVVDQPAPEQIAFDCDHCKQPVVFPGEMQGTVQECPNCAGYLDIPGGEDEFDWSVVDETLSEDELAEQNKENEEDADAWG